MAGRFDGRAKGSSNGPIRFQAGSAPVCRATDPQAIAVAHGWSSRRARPRPKRMARADRPVVKQAAAQNPRNRTRELGNLEFGIRDEFMIPTSHFLKIREASLRGLLPTSPLPGDGAAPPPPRGVFFSGKWWVLVLGHSHSHPRFLWPTQARLRDRPMPWPPRFPAHWRAGRR